MACGLAIITTDAPGCRDTVEPEINGLLVDVGDSRSLAEAMLFLYKNPHKVSQMGLASRRISVEKFSTRHVNNMIIQQMESAGELA
jgi:glycosyltransferase involved in cell wall biosynthesis